MSGAADPSSESAFLDMRALMTVVPDFATNDRLVEAVRLVDREQREARRSELRYRVAVLGTDTTDLVEHVGGLLFDHIMAGWQVTALVPDTADPRPLQILGARILDLDTALTMHLDAALTARGNYPWPDKIVIAGALASDNPRLREAVRQSFDDGDINTVLWGRHRPALDDATVTVVQHQLSVAARAFKAHALAATSAGAGVADIESFTGNKLRVAGPPTLHLA